MKTTNSDLSQCLNSFAQKFVERYQTINGHLPLTESDEQWISPCVQQKHNDELELWKPVLIADELSFSNVEEALGLNLHNDIGQYFTTIYSDSMTASCSEGMLTLLFSWCEQDFARLQENIIGHVLMKQRLKQAITIFFAVTDDDDIILSLKNDTGEIWVERIGCEPHKKIADSMWSFINSLSPEVIENENES